MHCVLKTYHKLFNNMCIMLYGKEEQWIKSLVLSVICTNLCCCLLNIYGRYLWVHHHWYPTTNTSANVLLSPFNLLCMPYDISNTFYQSILTLYTKKNIAKTHTLLYSAIDYLAFWYAWPYHFIRFQIGWAVKLNGCIKQYSCTAPLRSTFCCFTCTVYILYKSS